MPVQNEETVIPFILDKANLFRGSRRGGPAPPGPPPGRLLTGRLRAAASPGGAVASPGGAVATVGHGVVRWPGGAVAQPPPVRPANCLTFPGVVSVVGFDPDKGGVNKGTFKGL